MNVVTTIVPVFPDADFADLEGARQNCMIEVY
jgi:hypothetical protein